MSYCLADSTGPLVEFASIGGYAGFRSWAYEQSEPIKHFVQQGFTEDPYELYIALQETDAPASIEAQKAALTHAASDAEDILILSDGLSDDELYTLGGSGSGNFGHAGRPGEVGGSGDSEAPAQSIQVTKKQKHTKDRIAEALQMKQDGFSSSQIQKKTGLHPSTQYHHFKKMEKSQKEIEAKLKPPSFAEIEAYAKSQSDVPPVQPQTSTKPPALYYWKKNSETGKYEKTLTAAGKAQSPKSPSTPAITAKPLTASPLEMHDKAVKYGYEWKEKTIVQTYDPFAGLISSPDAGKYAWYQNGVQVSAPASKENSGAAAATLHYGQGPQSNTFEPGPTPSGWPISNDVPRQIGTNYPKQVEKVGEEWKEKLSYEERLAVKSYTGSGYIRTNPPLWKSPDHMSPKTKVIQDAIAKSPKPPPPELVWRGLSSGGDELVKGLTAGDVVQLNGFQSTSIKPEFAKGWGGHHIFEIKPAKGAYVHTISGYKHEYEYLLPHGAKYKVHGATKVKLGTHVVNVIQLEMQ